MENEKVFNFSQVAQHNSKKDCWLIINGKVLDVTQFLEEHPGGEEVLVEHSGKDATKVFEDIGHSKTAKNLLLKYKIGYLQGYDLHESETNETFVKETKGKEMKAFVIKDVSTLWSRIEFFLPFVAVALYLGYRYITGNIQF